VARDYAVLRRLQPTLFALQRDASAGSRASALLRLILRVRRRRLFVRRGYVVQRAGGGREEGGGEQPETTMIVHSLEMEEGTRPDSRSMRNVRRVCFASPEGALTLVDAELVRPPAFKVVAIVPD